MSKDKKEAMQEVVERITTIQTDLKAMCAYIDTENKKLTERLGRLEKQVMEPIAQKIVDGVRQAYTSERLPSGYGFAGYSRPLETHEFPCAVNAMIEGRRVTRMAWGDMSSQVYFCRNDNEFKFTENQIGKAQRPYSADTSDLMATDWVIL